MGSEWPVVRIEDIQAKEKGAIAIGPFGSRLKSDCYVRSGIPVIRGTNITGGPTFEGQFVYISEEKADTLGSSNVYKDDLVFPHRGSIGEVGIILENKRYVLSSSLMKLTCDRTKVNPKFLYYFFKSREGKHELLKNASQVGTPGIGQPLASLKSIEFHNPPILVQDKIEELITSLDNKIHLNRQTNQTLEQMAQALFKSWFIDFDPVIDNALAAGTSIPEELQARAALRKQQHARAREQNDPQATGTQTPTTGLPEDLRQLFPCEFEFTETLGWVPKGWEVGRIKNIAKTNPVSWTKKNAPDSVEYVDLANTKNGLIEETTRYSFEDAPSRARRVLERHNTIMGLVRPGNRSYAYVHRDGLTGSTGFAVMKPLEKNIRAFLYFMLTRNDVIDEYSRLADGAAYPAIRPEVVSQTECVIPSIALLERYQAIAGNFLTKIGVNSSQNVELSKLRDTLLPKLISGELRIPEAEQMLEELT